MPVSEKIERALSYMEGHFNDFIVELGQFIQIPSVTTDKRASEKAAQWTVEKLDRTGLENVQLHETIGNPVIYAQKICGIEGAPTVLIYGHYDVQLPDP